MNSRSQPSAVARSPVVGELGPPGLRQLDDAELAGVHLPAAVHRQVAGGQLVEDRQVAGQPAEGGGAEGILARVGVGREVLDQLGEAEVAVALSAKRCACCTCWSRAGKLPARVSMRSTTLLSNEPRIRSSSG